MNLPISEVFVPPANRASSTEDAGLERVQVVASNELSIRLHYDSHSLPTTTGSAIITRRFS